jgi:hypothetical protein
MGTNTPKNNRLDMTSSDQKLADGLGKHGSGIPTILIGGTPQAVTDIVATLQARINAAHAVLTSRATWQNAVVTDRAERMKTKAYVSGLKQALLVAFAGQVDVLADFGLTSRKPRVATPEAKVAAAAKAKATRAARHTMGKNQKAAIKGTLAAPAPVVSTAAPTPVAPAPAPVTPAPTQSAPTGAGTH